MGQLRQAETAMVFLQAHIASIVELVFNGLLTNDKFCLSRIVQLTRVRRRPRRLSVARQQDMIPLPPAGIPHPQGGDGETQMENAPHVGGPTNSAKTMGPCLPADPGVEHGHGHALPADESPDESATSNRAGRQSGSCPGGAR